MSKTRLKSGQISDNFNFSGKGGVAVPSGTSAERSNPADIGEIRYNTEINQFEGYSYSGWGNLAGSLISSTDDVPEGSNLYYTDARVYDALSGYTSALTVSSSAGLTLSGSSYASINLGTNNYITLGTGPAGRVVFNPAQIYMLNEPHIYGNLTFEGNITMAHPLPNTAIENSTVTINTTGGIAGGGTVDLGGTLTLYNTGVTNISGTTNQISVSNATGAVTISLPSNVTVSDLNITGNLTVQGTTTTVNATNLEIDDPLIYMGQGNVGNSKDLGFVGHFNNGLYQHTGLARRATDSKWYLFSGVTSEPDSNVVWTDPTFTVDTLVANIEGSVTGNSSTATRLQTGRTINGVEFDGTVNIGFNTDAVVEGNSNLYFTNSRARSALSFTAGSGFYNSTTGVITIPTNTNQLTNGAGFITGYTETDTLASVTGRGATTTTAISVTNTTASTSTTTGALVVSGGAGFAGSVYSGGLGSFANGVKASSLASSQATVNLYTDGTQTSINVGSSGTTTTVNGNLSINTTGYIQLPSGTTAQRPSSPVAGMARFNTTDSKFEVYDGANWSQLKPTFVATGGSVSTSGGFNYHAFTSSGTFTVNAGSSTVEVLVVAGGGGGGYDLGGGGGAGGLIYNASYAVTAGSYSVTVGAGGANSGASNVNGSNGSNSVFGSLTAIGGGGGGSYPAPTTGSSGGSGGGGGSTTGSGTVAGGSGTAGQGNAGGAGVRGFSDGNYGVTGGGGGAGQAGFNGDNQNGKGGNGLQYTQFASWGAPAGWFAGGGGGASDSGGAVGAGGSGGGGSGSGVAGTANTGGGGAGANLTSGSGGSGIVIIRYPL